MFVKGGDAKIESVEEHKLVEEAHAPLLCLRVLVVPPQYDVHPVYTLPPVLLASLCRDGSPCIPTPGVYQSGDRGVTAQASGPSTQESVQPHRECGRTTAVVQEGSQSQNSILVLRTSIIVSTNKVSSPVGILTS